MSPTKTVIVRTPPAQACRLGSGFGAAAKRSISRLGTKKTPPGKPAADKDRNESSEANPPQPFFLSAFLNCLWPAFWASPMVPRIFWASSLLLALKAASSLLVNSMSSFIFAW